MRTDAARKEGKQTHTTDLTGEVHDHEEQRTQKVELVLQHPLERHALVHELDGQAPGSNKERDSSETMYDDGHAPT